MNIKEWIEAGVWAAAFLIYLFTKIFKKKLPNVERESKEVDNPIYDRLYELLFSYNAFRAYILQWHNGTKYYSGQHIQRMTMSHERNRPGFKSIKTEHDSIQIPVEIHEAMRDMKRGVYYCENRDLIIDSKPDLYNWMRTNGASALIYFTLVDTKTREPIGLLGLNFNHTRPINDPQIAEILQFKRKFEVIFDKL